MRRTISTTLKFNYLILLISLLFTTHLLGQEKANHQHNSQCGTTLAEHSNPSLQRQIDQRWQNERDYYLSLVQDFQSDISRNIANVRMVPVQLHSIRTSAGVSGITASQYKEALDLANEYLIKGGIHLYQYNLYNTISYIDDDDYYDFDNTEQSDLHSAYGTTNVLNIYTTNTVTHGGGTICGYSTFPGGADFMIMADECTLDGSTFAHEVGHYFNLYHTHETANGAETVNGANCAIAGDLLCDTPADPQLDGTTGNSAGCTYNDIYNSKDANNASYTPSIINIMSYSSRECRVEFTNQQYARMLASIDADRTYLLSTQIGLNANFYSIPSAGSCNNMKVEFCNVSTSGSNTNTYAWDFGDGNTSTATSPTHTYTTPGVYNVQLTINDGTTTDVETRIHEVVVGAVTIPHTQDFEGNVASLYFNDSSTYKNSLTIHSIAAKSGNYGFGFYGDESDITPKFQTPASASQAFEDKWNPYYKSSIYICVDGRNHSTIALGFDIKQMYLENSNYSNFRITVNGTEVAAYQVASEAGEIWSTKSIDLSAYKNTVFTIGFEGSHKYDLDNNSTYIDNISITGVLPVELIAFEAQANQRQQVDLNWKTASQEGFSHFEVEHSADGKLFTKFSTVETNQVNSQAAIEYQDIHENPVTGNNYYRLKMVDLDGTFEYSDIKIIEFNHLTIGKEPVLFPNPITQGQSLTIQTPDLVNPNLVVYNSNGRMVKNILLEDSENIISTNEFAPGIYFYSIQSNSKIYNGKLVIVK